MWRMDNHADVVVRFDNGGHRLVFWRGTSYIPCWVTGNGIWYTNEFLERRGRGIKETKGLVEPMSDKQCRYSHVRIIESSNARVVIHWRYAPVDVYYQHPYVDAENGWGDWVDEYYTIYPDGVGIRKATIHTTAPDEFAEWHEAIVVNQPGTMPTDNIEPTAVTLANMKGESRDYTWTKDGTPEEFDNLPEDCCIQMVNLKSVKKPFTIVDPSGLNITTYGGHAPNSIFTHRDHWPVSQDKSWTRITTSADKPSHSSLFNLRDWKDYARSENSITKLMMNGMTEKSAGELVLLAKSWLKAPDAKLSTAAYSYDGYDPAQMAYVFSYRNKNTSRTLEFELFASEDSPVINPAFVIENWGDDDTNLVINEKQFKQGNNFRVGHRYRIEGSDLIVWLESELTKPVKVSFLAKQ